MEKLEDNIKKELTHKIFPKIPCPDWKKRVEIDIAYAMIQPSSNNCQDYEDTY